MLRFFRQLRKHFLTGNKISKYLLYAVGEIALVVIGILIALQVDNWNEIRKKRALEKKILTEIQSDLTIDILSLENDIQLNETGIKSINYIQTAIAADHPLNDTLKRELGRLIFNSTYTVKRSGYDNLQNRGFEIIENDTVRKLISDLYESVYSFLKETQETSDLQTYDYFAPKYLEYFSEIRRVPSIRSSERDRSYFTPSNYPSLKTDPSFHRLLDFLKWVKQKNLYEINLSLNALRETRQGLDEYLQTLDNR